MSDTSMSDATQWPVQSTNCTLPSVNQLLAQQSIARA